jgi:hypothetical protein
MNRIVITGSFLTGKTEVSLALAHLTGFTHVYPMSNYEAEKFIGSLNDDKNRFYRNFLNCLFRLSDRLKNETLTEENFISDGCVFNDIAYIKAYHDVIPIGNNSINKKEFKEQTLMIKAIENSILYYSKDRYDEIVFLEIDPTANLEPSDNNQKLRIQYNDYLKDILQKSGYQYSTYLSSDIELLLSKIVDDNNLNRIMAIKEALYKSHLNLYRENTNLNSIKFN